MGGGAWPFLVGGVICLVNSVNERDPRLLNSWANCLCIGFSQVTPGMKFKIRRREVLPFSFLGLAFSFLEGLLVTNQRKLGAITGL